LSSCVAQSSHSFSCVAAAGITVVNTVFGFDVRQSVWGY
jgi:hypothetical protein